MDSEKKRGFWGLIKLFKASFSEYRGAILVLTILSFVSGTLEGVGINAIIPLFSFINKSGGLGSDLISRFIAKMFSILHLNYTLMSLLIFIILLFAVKAVAWFLTNYIATYSKSSYEKKTRSNLFRATIDADWPHLSKQKIGHLEQILTTDVDNSSTLFVFMSETILVGANLIVYSLVVVNISWIVALAAMMMGVLVLTVLRPVFYKNRMVSSKRALLNKSLAHYVSENIIGMKVIKATAVRELIIKKAEKYFEEMKDLNMKVANSRNVTTAILQPAGMVFVVAIFAFFYKTTAFNFASFAVVVYAINKVFAYIQQAQSNLQMINSLVPYLVSAEEYKSDIKKHLEKDTGNLPFNFNKSLIFKDVYFSYTASGEGVLRGVSFEIKRGEMVGLVGPSGAGKTTIVDLALRLFIPQKGGIFLDGNDIFDISMREWRKHIEYVAQDIFLLNDTIENNIKFYSGSVSEKDIIEAAKTANIYDFIESLPEKFQTAVGERGILLSGGQRQRIILARVLTRHPQILILDEATSALDNESEVLIQQSIERLKGRVTVLVIAHRLSTVMASDKLIVLNEGKISEEGRPEELLKNKDSYFFKVYNVRT